MRQWRCGHSPPAAALPSSCTLSWLARCTSSSLLLLLLWCQQHERGEGNVLYVGAACHPLKRVTGVANRFR